MDDHELPIAAKPATPAATIKARRDRLAEAIRLAPRGERLREEVAYTLEVWRDDPECGECDEADAFRHVHHLAESEGDRPLARLCVDVLIEAGYYRPRRPGTVICGRDQAPVRNGVRYDPEEAWCVWFGEG